MDRVGQGKCQFIMSEQDLKGLKKEVKTWHYSLGLLNVNVEGLIEMS